MFNFNVYVCFRYFFIQTKLDSYRWYIQRWWSSGFQRQVEIWCKVYFSFLFLRWFFGAGYIKEDEILSKL